MLDACDAIRMTQGVAPRTRRNLRAVSDLRIGKSAPTKARISRCSNVSISALVLVILPASQARSEQASAYAFTARSRISEVSTRVATWPVTPQFLREDIKFVDGRIRSPRCAALQTWRFELADDASMLNAIELATELTIAWLGNPNTRASSDEVPSFLNQMHTAVLGLAKPQQTESALEPTQDFTPATTARRSLASKDHIISMIDGKPYKTLRRHLAGHGLTPEQYRERYRLKPDYPMVAPSYSEARRSMAQKIGLGQKGRAARKAAPAEGEAPKAAPRRRGRPPRAPKPE